MQAVKTVLFLFLKRGALLEALGQGMNKPAVRMWVLFWYIQGRNNGRRPNNEHCQRADSGPGERVVKGPLVREQWDEEKEQWKTERGPRWNEKE